MQITVSAPATIANFGPGFDVFGMCIDRPHDIMRLETTGSKDIKIFCSYKETHKEWDDLLKNTAGLAATTVLNRFIERYPKQRSRVENTGVKIDIAKGYSVGSGLGSSAASAAGAAFAVHAVLSKKTGCSLSARDIAECAAEGEGAAGGVHPDNTTPCLFGGFTVAFAPEIKYKTVKWEREQYKQFKGALSRYVDKTQGFRRFVPPEMYFSIIFPKVKLLTKKMRAVLEKADGSRADVSSNVELVERIVAGFEKGDFDMICGNPANGEDNLDDTIVTPARKVKIPYFDAMKAAAKSRGARSFIICGSGPSVAAISKDRKTADIILGAMRDACKMDVELSFVAEPNPNGVEVLYDNFGFKKNTAKSGAELLEKLK